MASTDGVLLGVIWMIFTLLFAIVTVAWHKPSTSLDTVRSLMVPSSYSSQS
jgi:hypothetical protein